MTREVTLAATQFACTWEIEENLARAERLVREAAGSRRADRAAAGALRDAVLLHHAGHAALRAGATAEGSSHGRALQPPGRRAGRRHPRQLLRARRPGVLQLGRRGGRRRLRARRLPQEPHPRLRRLPGEVLLHARRHRFSGLGHALRAHRRGHLLGPVVPGGGPRDGAAGRRSAALPDGDRQRPARSPRTTRATAGSWRSAATR